MRGQPKETKEQILRQLNNEKERLKELEEQGCSALSDFDISMEIGIGGKASTALRCAKRLVNAHISYYEDKLKQFEPQHQLTNHILK